MGIQKQRGKPRGMRRDRDCRDCKARSVKCDLNRPRCLPCVQAGLSCGYAQRVIWTGKRSKSAKTGGTDGIADTRDAYIDPSENDKHSFLLRLASFCRHIKSTQLLHTDYPTESVRLVSCLSDLMDARIRNCPSPGQTSPELDMARHHLAALMELNAALKNANPFAILGIAAFAVFEVFESAFGEWQRHLYGAKSLLDCHCRNPEEFDRLAKSVTGLTEIVARLIWFDVNGTIARGATGLIFEDWHRQLLNDTFFRIVGCPSDAFDAFVRVAKGEIGDTPAACFQAMEMLLRITPNESDWDKCANMNRCAVVLAIIGRLETSPAQDSTVRLAVDKICRLISALSPSSPFYVHVATPVYLAGLDATTNEHCGIVSRYWRSSAVPRSLDGLRRCEERWRWRGLQVDEYS